MISIIRVPLASDEIAALQRMAKAECRLDYEQIRFALRNYLIASGALPGVTIFNPNSGNTPTGENS
jgi:hypothetical protein